MLILNEERAFQRFIPLLSLSDCASVNRGLMSCRRNSFRLQPNASPWQFQTHFFPLALSLASLLEDISDPTRRESPLFSPC